MPLPFFESSTRRLDAIVRQGLMCVFDFDGTLAPLVRQPEEARVPAPILRRIAALSHHAPVGVITGRAVTDLRARLGFEPDFAVGNHGLEGMPEGDDVSRHYKELCLGWQATLAVALKEMTCAQGVWIEDKGYSLSVHYRLARDHAMIEQRLAAVLSRLSPPARVVAGKCVFNVLPEGAGNKGTALAHLMQRCGAAGAIYIGDDVTDEDVFQLHRPDVLTIRIGHGSDSAAEFFLPHRLDMVHVLDGLIGRLRQAGAQNWMRTEVANHAE